MIFSGYFHFLIVDREKNGADKFEGELILFGCDRFPHWESLMNYLVSGN